MLSAGDGMVVVRCRVRCACGKFSELGNLERYINPVCKWSTNVPSNKVEENQGKYDAVDVWCLTKEASVK